MFAVCQEIQWSCETKSPVEHSQNLTLGPTLNSVNFCTVCFNTVLSSISCGPDSSVGIATGYRVDGLGIESRWGRDFPPVQTGPVTHPASCTIGTRSFPGVKCGRGVTLSTHTLLVPWSRKSRAIPLLPLWAVRPVQSLSACTRVHFTFTYTSTPPIGRTACTEPQYLYKRALYLYLYLYSPYGPYGLYRASVPVQGCTLPLPIPLLSL